MTATGFYVSVEDHGRHGMLLGPYTTKGEAEADVPLGKRLAERANSRAIWYAYGVTKVTMQPGADLPAGKLEHLRPLPDTEQTDARAGGTITGVSAAGNRVVIAQYRHQNINEKESS